MEKSSPSDSNPYQAPVEELVDVDEPLQDPSKKWGTSESNDQPMALALGGGFVIGLLVGGATLPFGEILEGVTQVVLCLGLLVLAVVLFWHPRKMPMNHRLGPYLIESALMCLFALFGQVLVVQDLTDAQLTALSFVWIISWTLGVAGFPLLSSQDEKPASAKASVKK